VKPPRYPLAAVLEQRGALREQTRRGLAEALGALAEREQELAGAQAARAALSAEREDLERHLYDPDEAGLLSIPLIDRRTDALKNVEERLRSAERTVDNCRQAVVGAEDEVGSCRERLLEADRELKAAEKHHEGWRAEWLRERTHREQRQNEEVTLARFAADAAADDSEQGGPT
jgi:flagellar export protein FliJ